MKRPLQLTLCLTRNCTLRCRYCYAGAKRAQSMSRETAELGIEAGLSEALRTGRGVDMAFFGGEPLLEWELLQYCHDYFARRAAELGVAVRCGLTTNGTLLSRERLAWLAERDYLVGLSVDGSSAMHDANRCYPDGRGSHADVARALELMRGFPSLRSRVICVVNPANHHLLLEGVEWLHRHYPGAFTLSFDYWSEWSDARFESLRLQLEKLASFVLESYRAGDPLREDGMEGKMLTAVSPPRSGCVHCRIGEQELAVSVDGHFFPCSRMVGVGDEPEISFGHVKTGIDRAKQNYYIATRGNATPECRVCEIRHRCMNSCGCTNYAASGAINRVSPFLCNLEQTLIMLADNVAETLFEEKNPLFMRRFYSRKAD